MKKSNMSIIIIVAFVVVAVVALIFSSNNRNAQKVKHEQAEQQRYQEVVTDMRRLAKEARAAGEHPNSREEYRALAAEASELHERHPDLTIKTSSPTPD